MTGARFKTFSRLVSQTVAKKYLLKPFKSVFPESIFEKPANGKYTWLNAERARAFSCMSFVAQKKRSLLLLEERQSSRQPLRFFVLKTLILQIMPSFL